MVESIITALFFHLLQLGLEYLVGVEMSEFTIE